MQGRLNLQGRLVLLVIAAILPVALLSLWFAVDATQGVTRQAQVQLKLSASLVAAHQDRMVESAQQLLGAIAAMPGLRAMEQPLCVRYFEGLRARYPVYSNIGVLDLNGRTVCHANQREGDFAAGDRAYVQRALAERRLVMGQAVMGRSSGRLVIPFAEPIMEGDNMVGLVFASLDVGRAASALADFDLPEGATVIVADRRGQVLMQHPANTTGAPPLVVPLPASSGTGGTGEVQDSLGHLLYGFAASREVTGEGFVATLTLDRDRMTGPSATQLRNELLMLAATLLAGVAAAWWIGGYAIVKPAKQILGAVRRLEQGRLEARVPLQSGSPRDEFARIGAAFNLMAESLQLRQLDLETELGRSRSAYGVLDLVLNSMQEGLVAVTPAGEVLMFNEAAARWFPLNEPGLHKEQWAERLGFFHPDGTTAYRTEELPLVRSAHGESGRLQQLIVRNALVPDGRLLQCSWQPIRADGGISGGLVVFTDVTELQRLQAEQTTQFERLRETQRKLMEAQRIGRVGNWELDLESGRLWWSDEVYVLFGVTRAGFEPTLSSFESCVHPQDRDLLKPARDVGLRDGMVMEVEYRVVKPDGSIAWMHQIGQARRNDQGEPVWFGGVVQDITMRKENETENVRLFAQIRELNAGLETRIAERTEELTRQEQLYRTFAEQAPVVVWNTDATGARLTFVNRAWYELIGGTPQDWIGKSGMAAIHPDDRAAVAANWLRCSQSLSIFAGVRRVKARDGAYHSMSYKGAPVLDSEGKVASWVGVDSDITELKAIESALRSSNQELEAFSYSVSHDLRAPLGAIGGFSRALTLQLAGHADERVLHYLARIQAGVGKMEQLIEALLSLAQVVRAPLSYGLVDLTAMARETLEGLMMQDPDRRATLQIQEGLVAQGDARLLRIVMENLLGNSWKFTSRSSAALIEVGWQADGGAFFVRDNGVGFDMAYAGKLFGAFQRLHTEAEFPGTGIGLATVRRIVARHQGRVWAESKAGEGTSFYFALSDSAPPAWLLGGSRA